MTVMTVMRDRDGRTWTQAVYVQLPSRSRSLSAGRAARAEAGWEEAQGREGDGRVARRAWRRW